MYLLPNRKKLKKNIQIERGVTTEQKVRYIHSHIYTKQTPSADGDNNDTMMLEMKAKSDLLYAKVKNKKIIKT